MPGSYMSQKYVIQLWIRSWICIFAEQALHQQSHLPKSWVHSNFYLNLVSKLTIKIDSLKKLFSRTS